LSRAGWNFCTRTEARVKLMTRQAYKQDRPRWFTRLRNYEYEYRLAEEFGGRWVISEWCPFNGRFCALREFVDPPWPPMASEARGEQTIVVDVGKVASPWRNFDGSLTDDYVQTDAEDPA
jgi:hypothetical protein